jgi:hypothetical protein
MAPSLILTPFLKRYLTAQVKLFNHLKGYPFTRGLPRAEILQRPEIASIFKRAVACGEVSEVSVDDSKKSTEV